MINGTQNVTITCQMCFQSPCTGVWFCLIKQLRDHQFHLIHSIHNHASDLIWILFCFLAMVVVFFPLLPLKEKILHDVLTVNDNAWKFDIVDVLWLLPLKVVMLNVKQIIIISCHFISRFLFLFFQHNTNITFCKTSCLQ